VRLPIIELGDIYISYARLLAFAMALVGAVALYFFSGDPSSGLRSARSPRTATIVGLMGVDQRRVYLVTSAIGERWRGSPPVSCHYSTTSIPSSEIRSDRSSS